MSFRSRHFSRIVLTVLAAMLFAAWVIAATGSAESPHPVTAHDCASERLNKMIGQTIMVGFPGRRTQDRGVQAVLEQLRDGTIGGVILFPKNIADKAQLKALTDALMQTRSDLPPFIAVDQEGGRVQRLRARKGFEWFPSAKLVGDNPSLDAQDVAEEIYRQMAVELASLGFNMNLGPVVDVNTNPDNPVIGLLGRSFGASADVVSPMAAAFINAHHAANVATVAKHFPGHGSSSVDSHRTYVDISQSWREEELDPYRRLVLQGLLDGVMLGHLYHPRFSDLQGLPASLSAKAVDVLRGPNGLGFDGVIISDDMEMGAIRERFSAEEAAVRAIKAGTDIVIFSNIDRDDPEFGRRIHQALVDAVCDGQISEQRIGDAYRRVVRLKEQLKAKTLPTAW
ncbi:MAG: glycoside hydrolase family 3 protein [Methyloceanibacter sp.]|nr:glycoside hydrolase family 3 protein [Methyloceanibacter sp.]